MRCLLGLFLLFVGASIANADLLAYHFDSGNEGWRRGDLNIANLAMTDVGPATWNTSGYIDAPDFANWSFHLSPVITADLSSASRLEFDYSSAASDGPYPFILFSSGVGVIYQTTTVPGDGEFHHYNYAFTPGTWQFSDGINFRVATVNDITVTMQNLQQFGINGDQQHGPEYTRLDNVVIVPEPTSALALCMAGFGLARHRRAKK
jgi:hypothetical protein